MNWFYYKGINKSSQKNTFIYFLSCIMKALTSWCNDFLPFLHMAILCVNACCCGVEVNHSAVCVIPSMGIVSPATVFTDN